MADEVRARHILVDNEEHANQIKLELERSDKSFEEIARESLKGLPARKEETWDSSAEGKWFRHSRKKPLTWIQENSLNQ
jgi:hypothetical protein